MTPTDLEKAVQEALASSDVKLRRVVELISLSTKQQAEFEAAARAATARSIDPKVTADEAARAKAEASDLAFALRRTEAALEALEVKRHKLDEAEAAARWEAEKAAALAERDELAKEIAEVYPAVSAQLIDLFARILANDARIRLAAPGALGAEFLARGAPGNGQWPAGGGPVAPLTKIKLPNFDRQGLAWPRHDFNPAVAFDPSQSLHAGGAPSGPTARFVA